MLEIDALLERRPGQLSGGQRQRVAIGRAIVRNPTAFLLDEPLSNLDAELRVSMRAELAALHARLGTTMIYVTHDQVEAMTLADRIVVLRAGRIEQADTPLALFNRPANRFVAGFIGAPSMNFLPAGEVHAAHPETAVTVGHPPAAPAPRRPGRHRQHRRRGPPRRGARHRDRRARRHRLRRPHPRRPPRPGQPLPGHPHRARGRRLRPALLRRRRRACLESVRDRQRRPASASVRNASVARRIAGVSWWPLVGLAVNAQRRLRPRRRVGGTQRRQRRLGRGGRRQRVGVAEADELRPRRDQPRDRPVRRDAEQPRHRQVMPVPVVRPARDERREIGEAAQMRDRRHPRFDRRQPVAERRAHRQAEDADPRRVGPRIGRQPVERRRKLAQHLPGQRPAPPERRLRRRALRHRSPARRSTAGRSPAPGTRPAPAPAPSPRRATAARRRPPPRRSRSVRHARGCRGSPARGRRPRARGGARSPPRRAGWRSGPGSAIRPPRVSTVAPRKASGCAPISNRRRSVSLSSVMRSPGCRAPA